LNQSIVQSSKERGAMMSYIEQQGVNVAFGGEHCCFQTNQRFFVEAPTVLLGSML
jgi:hypothetical protein